jgi:hypothetical protein
MTVFEQLQPRHIEFIRAQHLFFVATAPLSHEGHVNLSPKGYDSFEVIDAWRVAYVDLGGSSVETQAHLEENGRICLMFCSFDRTPLIVRLYGRGRVHVAGCDAFAALRPRFDKIRGAVRAIIEIELTRVQDSCAWGMPFFEHRGDRSTPPGASS